MHFGYTIVYVPDVQTATTFYERAFGFRLRFNADDWDYAELGDWRYHSGLRRREDDRIARHRYTPNRPDATAAGIELAFVTETLATTSARALEAGATGGRAEQDAMGTGCLLCPRSQRCPDRNLLPGRRLAKLTTSPEIDGQRASPLGFSQLRKLLDVVIGCVCAGCGRDGGNHEVCVSTCDATLASCLAPDGPLAAVRLIIIRLSVGGCWTLSPDRFRERDRRQIYLAAS